MSYFRNAMKRPMNTMPDHVLNGSPGSASPVGEFIDPFGLDGSTAAGDRAFHSAYEGVMTETQESYVHLSRSMLVRLNIRRSNGDSTPVLCVSQEVKHTGLKMRLPCRLALSPGAVLDMELFTLFRDTPVAVKAVVENVVRTVGEDIVRYMVEVRFKNLAPPAEHEINAFIHAAQLDERRMMLA